MSSSLFCQPRKLLQLLLSSVKLSRIQNERKLNTASKYVVNSVAHTGDNKENNIKYFTTATECIKQYEYSVSNTNDTHCNENYCVSGFANDMMTNLHPVLRNVSSASGGMAVRMFSSVASNSLEAPNKKNKSITANRMLSSTTSSKGPPANGSPANGPPATVWALGRLNHIAIAVPDLEKATSFYRDVLGATVSAPQDLPEHGVTTVFVELANTKLELLLPLGDNSPIAKFLKKNKAGGLHHVCIEVDDIKAAMRSLEAAAVRCLSKEPKIGAHGKPVVFLHPLDCNGVLVELEEA